MNMKIETSVSLEITAAKYRTVDASSLDESFMDCELVRRNTGSFSNHYLMTGLKWHNGSSSAVLELKSKNGATAIMLIELSERLRELAGQMQGGNFGS